MTRTLGLLILSFSLVGCSSDSEDASFTDQSDDDDSEWLEEGEGEIETGSLTINLPGEHGSGRAMCSVNITRIVEQRLANVILMLDVIGRGCDGMGNCDNPNMREGDLNYSGGIDGDQPFATMIVNYEPPRDSEDGPMWMYNSFYKTAPFSRFDMWVDGEPFNALTSDTRGAEDLTKGRQMWATKIDIEADMLQVPNDSEQSVPGIQTRGKFTYEGLCEVTARYLQP